MRVWDFVKGSWKVVESGCLLMPGCIPGSPPTWLTLDFRTFGFWRAMCHYTDKLNKMQMREAFMIMGVYLCGIRPSPGPSAVFSGLWDGSPLSQVFKSSSKSVYSVLSSALLPSTHVRPCGPDTASAFLVIAWHHVMSLSRIPQSFCLHSWQAQSFHPFIPC